MRSRHTILDLAAAVGVLAVLAALGVPFVQHSATSERKAMCLNNLRNLALCPTIFAWRFGGLPPAKTYRPIATAPEGRAFIGSVFCNLLNDMDQVDLFNALNFDVPMYAIDDLPPENRTVAETRISYLYCPTDPNSRSAPYAPTSYRANVGLGGLGPIGGLGREPQQPSPWDRGAFDEMRIVPLAEFTNGTSVTIAFAEKLIGGGRGRPFDPARDWFPAAPPGAATDPDGWVRVCSAPPPRGAPKVGTDAGRCWMLSGSLYSTYQGYLPPNSEIPDCGSDALNGVGFFGPRSLHPGGAFAAWVDGSARFVRSTIETGIWRSTQARQGWQFHGGSF